MPPGRKGTLILKFSVTMKKNHEFRRLYAKGKSVAASTLVVYFRKNGRDYNQLGLTVSTKVGNAVCRNSIRRKLRAIYRLNEERLRPGLDIVVVARNKAAFSDYHRLEKDFLYCCGKLGVFADSAKAGEKK